MTLGRHAFLHLTWVLPVAFWPGSTSFDPPKFLAWTVAVAVWLATVRALPLAPAAGGLLALAAAALAGLAAPAPSPPHALRVAGALLIAAVTLAAAAQGDTPLRRRLLWGLQAGGLFNGVIVLLQAAGAVPGTPDTVFMARGIGCLGNPNYASALAAALLWPAFLFLLDGDKRERIIAGACIITHAGVLAANGASGPVAAVVAAGLLSGPAWFARRRLQRRDAADLAVAAFVTAAVAGAAFGIAGALGWQPVRELPLLQANDGELRLANWAAATSMIEASPVLGVGAGQFGHAWLDHRPLLDMDTPPAPIPLRAHNEALQWIAETGLVGAAVLVLVLVIVAASARRHLRAEDGTVGFAALAGLTTLAIHASVSFPLHLPATGLVAAVLLGVAADRPRELKLRMPGRLALAAAAMVLALGASREFRADHRIASGRSLLAAGKAQAAAHRLQQGIEDAVWPGLGRLHLAQALRAVGGQGPIRATLEQGLRDRPSYESIALMAEDDIEHGRFTEAGRQLDRLAACRPPYAVELEIRYLQAYAALRGGDDVGARRVLGALLEDVPEYPRAHLALGYIAARQGDLTEAAGHYRRALAAITSQLDGPHDPLDRPRLRGMLEVARRALASVSD